MTQKPDKATTTQNFDGPQVLDLTDTGKKLALLQQLIQNALGTFGQIAIHGGVLQSAVVALHSLPAAMKKQSEENAEKDAEIGELEKEKATQADSIHDQGVEIATLGTLNATQADTIRILRKDYEKLERGIGDAFAAVVDDEWPTHADVEKHFESEACRLSAASRALDLDRTNAKNTLTFWVATEIRGMASGLLAFYAKGPEGWGVQIAEEIAVEAPAPIPLFSEEEIKILGEGAVSYESARKFGGSSKQLWAEDNWDLACRVATHRGVSPERDERVWEAVLAFVADQDLPF